MNYQLDNSASTISVDPALIVAYANVGDIKTLETFDYTLFTRQQIWTMCCEVVNDFVNYNRAGADFLEKIANTVYTCDTKDYTIYLRPVSEAHKIHKVLNKTSNTFSAMYDVDLAKIIFDERLDVPYFKNVKPRSTYVPVLITPSVILDYCKNGQIELLKNINFSMIPANHIRHIYQQVVAFQTELEKGGKDVYDPLYSTEMWNNLYACVSFMDDKDDHEGFIETENLILYDKPLKYKGDTVYKVFDRISNSFTMIDQKQVHVFLTNQGLQDYSPIF
jgi:hypothetical protein